MFLIFQIVTPYIPLCYCAQSHSKLAVTS